MRKEAALWTDDRTNDDQCTLMTPKGESKGMTVLDLTDVLSSSGAGHRIGLTTFLTTDLTNSKGFCPVNGEVDMFLTTDKTFVTTDRTNSKGFCPMYGVVDMVLTTDETFLTDDKTGSFVLQGVLPREGKGS
jgi:hypothetical protein